MAKEMRDQDELLDETFGEAEEPNPGTKRTEPEGEEGGGSDDAGADDESAGVAGSAGEDTSDEGGKAGEGDISEEPVAREDEIDDFLKDRVDVSDDEGDEDEGEGEEEEGDSKPAGEGEPVDEGDGEEQEAFEAYDLTEEEYEEITSSPEKFAEFATQLRKEAQADALTEARKEMKKEIADAKEEILRNIPEVVQKSATRAQSVQELRNNFFENNPALKQKLPYVRDMTATVATQNPDWSAKQVLDEVAKRANRDLDLSEQAKEREKKRKSDDPKFAGAGGRRSPSGEKDNRSKQERLLDDTFGTN